MATESDDPDVARFTERVDNFHKLDDDDKLGLVRALIGRGNLVRRDDAFELVRTQFPSVAEDLARSISFHVYQELPDVAVDLLAWIELNLREGTHERHAGIDFDLRYHLYNWLQAEALVPYGRQDVFEELTEIKDCLSRDDKESAAAILNSLIERFETTMRPPDVE